MSLIIVSNKDGLQWVFFSSTKASKQIVIFIVHSHSVSNALDTSCLIVCKLKLELDQADNLPWNSIPKDGAATLRARQPICTGQF